MESLKTETGQPFDPMPDKCPFCCRFTTEQYLDERGKETGVWYCNNCHEFYEELYVPGKLNNKTGENTYTVFENAYKPS